MAGETSSTEGPNAQCVEASAPPPPPSSSSPPSPAKPSAHTGKSRNRWWAPAPASPYALRPRNRCAVEEEQCEHEGARQPGLGDTIAMLINAGTENEEDIMIDREPYTITYPVRVKEGPNVATSLKLRSIPNSKVKQQADDDAGDIVFPIPAKDRERSNIDDATCKEEKDKEASEAILVVGFVDYELLNGVESQPSLGARLIAVNDASVEVGDWTLPKILGELQVHKEQTAGERETRISLTFRNDRLSDEDIAYLNGPSHGEKEPIDDEGEEDNEHPNSASIFARIRSTARSVAEAASTIDAANESEIRASRAKNAVEYREKHPNSEHSDNTEDGKETEQCGTDDPLITAEEQTETSSPRSSLFARIRSRAAVTDISSSVVDSPTSGERAASQADLLKSTLGIDTTDIANDSNPFPKSDASCGSPNNQNGIRRAPSREVFQVLHSHRALDIHRGRIVSGADSDALEIHSVLVSESGSGASRSSILSSDSEIEHD